MPPEVSFYLSQCLYAMMVVRGTPPPLYMCILQRDDTYVRYLKAALAVSINFDDH